MNHLMLWIYLFGVADNVSRFFCGLAFLFVFSGGVFWFISVVMKHNPPTQNSYYSEKETDEQFNKKISNWESTTKNFGRLKYLLFLGLIFGIASDLIPSKETIAAMIIIPKIAENKDIQQLPANVAHTLNEAVIDWGKELAPKKEGK